MKRHKARVRHFKGFCLIHLRHLHLRQMLQGVPYSVFITCGALYTRRINQPAAYLRRYHMVYSTLDLRIDVVSRVSDIMSTDIGTSCWYVPGTCLLLL